MTTTGKKPWKAPEPGDTLTLPDGRVWTVTAVAPRGTWPGEERVSYDFVAEDGTHRKASPMLRDFVTRFGQLATKGAVYRRGRRSVSVEVPVFDARPEGAAIGDLVHAEGHLFARCRDGWLLVEPPSATDGGRR